MGEGEDRRDLEALCSRLGLNDSVTFVGHVRHDELSGVFDRHDLSVMPSFEDYTGRAGVEAISRSVPVITSPQSGVAEVLVEDGRNGIVVDPTNRGAFSAALTALDRQLLARLRQGAFESAEQMSTAACTDQVLRAVATATAAGSETPI